MEFLSRHWKYASLASQHFARAVRSGAIGVPSVEILGAGSLSEELEKKPIVCVFGGEELVVGVDSCVAEFGLFGPFSSGVFATVWQDGEVSSQIINIYLLQTSML